MPTCSSRTARSTSTCWPSDPGGRAHSPKRTERPARGVLPEKTGPRTRPHPRSDLRGTVLERGRCFGFRRDQAKRAPLWGALCRGRPGHGQDPILGPSSGAPSRRTALRFGECGNPHPSKRLPCQFTMTLPPALFGHARTTTTDCFAGRSQSSAGTMAGAPSPIRIAGARRPWQSTFRQAGSTNSKARSARFAGAFPSWRTPA